MCNVEQTNTHMNALSQFLTTRSFEDSIFNGKITISEADEKRIDLSENILDFNKKAGLRTKVDKKKKSYL